MTAKSRLSRIWAGSWRRLLILAFLAGGIVMFRHLEMDDYLSFEYLKENRTNLQSYVDLHYAKSVLLFGLIYIGAALFIPGAVVLTLGGGFLFGVFPGVLYVNFFATLGAVISLLMSRHVVGTWLQRRYAAQLETLNSLIERNGAGYLLVLRIVPVLPFFAVNYLAGLTLVRVRTFVWTTSLGMLPGSLIYAYAGKRLGSVTGTDQLLTPGNLVLLLVLALFSLIPPLAAHYLKRDRGGD